MDYKEKLEEAKKIYETANVDQIYVLESLFPELKESEDEKMRRWIINYLDNKALNSGIIQEKTNIKNAIAWLEKQGEQNPVNWLQELEDKLANATPKQLAEWKEKYFKEEPAEWSEEDETGLTNTIIMLKEGASLHFNKNDITKAVDWLKSLKDRVVPQPKQEWSEEDETILANLIYALANDRIGNNRDEYVDFLKSLRPQNKYAYNPYKKVVESIAEMCKHYDKASYSGLRDFYNNVKVKCKDAKEYDSLFPQNRWKPSDEQIKALNYVVNLMASSESPKENDYYYNVFKDLREQLKKLKDEK